MSLPNIFTKEVSEQVIARIEKLTPTTPHLRGKMTVDQMLAHCNITYEYVYEPTKHQSPNFFIKSILKLFVKKIVTNEKDFKHNSSTAPDFIITWDKDFEAEKKRLINFITKTQALWETHFEWLESHSFGKLNTTERNNMFYKHLDHHLRQFWV